MKNLILLLTTLLLAGTALGQANVYDHWGGEGDELGTSMVSLGDVDGDGLDDYAVGAPHGTGAQPDSGYVEVRSAATGAVIYRRDGASTGNLFGKSLAAVGDIDGDGVSELIVGAPGRAGVHVLSGATGATVKALTMAPSTRAGWSVAGPGDVNGDGVPDFAFGLPEGGSPFAPPGSVRIHSGASGFLQRIYDGDNNGDLYGWSIDSAGDIDGDGSGDLVIGAPGVDRLLPSGVIQLSAGYMYVVGGDVSNHLIYYVVGIHAGAQLGYSVAGGVDVIGDGTPDFACGAPYFDNSGNTDAGLLWVFGGEGVGAPYLYLPGAQAGAELGAAIALIGDIDGSGKGEVVVGAPGTDAGGLVDVGRTHILKGETGAELFHMNGALDGERMGTAVADGGHLNADSFTDVFSAASQSSHGYYGVNAGRMRAVLGSSPTVSWYCTAKVNSAGCTPVITYSGGPSQSVGDNFLVYGTNVLSGKPGMLIWSYAQNAAPFFGGTLCVKAPIVRTPVQSAFVNNPGQTCSGAYAFHFSHAYMAAKNVPVGAMVHFQYWSRDSGFAPPNSVGLTGGLRTPIHP